jgi:hypothetical protein
MPVAPRDAMCMDSPSGFVEWRARMVDGPPKPVNPAPHLGPRPLVEACRASGHDRAGARCPECPLRALCESEERWLVRREKEARPRRRTLH